MNTGKIWKFDQGNRSIGNAVRCGTDFPHKASPPWRAEVKRRRLIPAEFAETKTAAGRRRMCRTRLAHNSHRPSPDNREVALQPTSPQVLGSERPIPSYVNTWVTIHEMLAEALPRMDSCVFDITTMPREALWITPDLLTEAGLPGKIFYHRANNHGDWCGCEPDRPHIVPKPGGVPSLDGPTKLLILSGYDEDRSEQLIASFEPDETLILYQEGLHEENRLKNEKKHRLSFINRQTIGFDSIDCYAPDWGFARVQKIVSKFAPDSNLILASLGPKTSAVSLYRLQRHFPKSGLIYSPCKDYNVDYSKGIGDTLTIDWIPKQVLPQGD